jgi:hypothetical protein
MSAVIRNQLCLSYKEIDYIKNWRLLVHSLYFGVQHGEWPRFAIWCVVYCTVPYDWYLFSQWLTATHKCKIPEFFITSTSHLFSLSF